MGNASTLGGSIKGRLVGRKRKQEPPRDTAPGQLLHYLASLIEQSDYTVDDVASHLGINRTTMYRWLSGIGGGPTLDQLDQIAKLLGKRDAWSLKPPQRFIDSL